MRKVIFTLALTAMAAGTILSSCQSSATKVENAQEKVEEATADVAKAEQDLNQARLDSVEQFRKESAMRISANEKSIMELKLKIAREKKETKAIYEKRLAELETKNTDMKTRLDNFKDEGKEKWYTFKTEFNHDMDDLGKSFKDFTVKNVK